MKLNKLLPVVAAFLTVACVMPASAETHYKPHISIGARGGMTMSRMSFSPSVPQSWAKGAVVGVTFRYAEERIFGLIGELNIEQRGWSESFDPDETTRGDLEYRRTLTYLELPIMTHIYFGSSRFKCFVNLGPEFGVLLSSSISSNFDYADPAAVQALVGPHRHTEQMRMDIKNKLDYGITAGMGCEFFVRPRHSISVEARFYYGLGNIFASSKADTFSASRGMSLEFTAGYAFRLR